MLEKPYFHYWEVFPSISLFDPFRVCIWGFSIVVVIDLERTIRAWIPWLKSFLRQVDWWMDEFLCFDKDTWSLWFSLIVAFMFMFWNKCMWMSYWIIMGLNVVVELYLWLAFNAFRPFEWIIVVVAFSFVGWMDCRRRRSLDECLWKYGRSMEGAFSSFYCREMNEHDKEGIKSEMSSFWTQQSVFCTWRSARGQPAANRLTIQRLTARWPNSRGSFSRERLFTLEPTVSSRLASG